MTERLGRAQSTDLSDHALWEYELILGIQPKQLGKTVLDLGCGISGKFGRELREVRPDVTVVSLSPQLSEPGRHDGHEMSGRVAGIAQQLPLLSDSIDTIVGLDSVPCFVPANDLGITFDEVWRVLAPGGEARLWPKVVYDTDHPVFFNTAAEEFMSDEKLPDWLLSSDVFAHPEHSSRLVISKPEN